MKKFICISIVTFLMMTQVQAKTILIPYDGLMIAVNVEDTVGKPKANAGEDINTYVGKSVMIRGSGTDTDGAIVSYEWKKNNSVIATSASFEYTPVQEGKETLTLTVMDDDGLTASDTMVVTAKLDDDTGPN